MVSSEQRGKVARREMDEELGGQCLVEMRLDETLGNVLGGGADAEGKV